jgi:hypothetical protein
MDNSYGVKACHVIFREGFGDEIIEIHLLKFGFGRLSFHILSITEKLTTAPSTGSHICEKVGLI